MIGIYKKDLMQIAGSWIILLIVTITVCAGLIYFDAPIGMLAYFPSFFAMQGTATIFADRACGWYRMETTLPYSRKRLMGSKYALCAVLAAVGLGLGLLIWMAATAIQGKPVDLSLDEVKINLCIGLIITFSTLAILIPLSYTTRKSQQFVATFASFLLPAVMVFYWTTSITSDVTMEGGQVVEMVINMQFPLLNGFTAFSIILFLISWLIMPAWLAKRDQR